MALSCLCCFCCVCDQVNQLVPVQDMDDIDAVHQLDPVRQVDHKMNWWAMAMATAIACYWGWGLNAKLGFVPA